MLLVTAIILANVTSFGQTIPKNKTTVAYLTDMDYFPCGVGLYLPIKNTDVGWYMSYSIPINNIDTQFLNVGISYNLNKIVSVYYGIGVLTLDNINQDYTFNYGVILYGDKNISMIIGYNTNINNINLGIGYTF